jgi:hypothetical protein
VTQIFHSGQLNHGGDRNIFEVMTLTLPKRTIVLLVEESGVSGENHQPVASHRYTSLHNIVLSTPLHEQHSVL